MGILHVCEGVVCCFFLEGMNCLIFLSFCSLSAYRLLKFISCSVDLALEMFIFRFNFSPLHMSTSQQVYLSPPTVKIYNIKSERQPTHFLALLEDSSKSSLSLVKSEDIKKYNTTRIPLALSHPLFIYFQSWVKIPWGLSWNLKMALHSARPNLMNICSLSSQ